MTDIKTDEDIKKELQAPFQPQDIEWRIQKSGLKDGKPWAMVVPFITSRAITKRLDDVLGLFGWEDVYKAAPPSTNKDGKVINNWLCGITIKNGDKEVTKWDGSPETKIEQFKGGLSGALKRSGSVLGVGRYLYQLNVVFAICVVVNSRRECNDEYPNFDSIKQKNADVWVNFAWANPPLPEWALPGSDFNKFLEPIKNAETMLDLRRSFEVAYKQAESSGNNDNTETLIQAKDKRKAEIEQQIQKDIESNYKKVAAWLKKQTDTFPLIPNESAVNTIYRTINSSLVDKCKTLDLNPLAMTELLKNEYESRVKELQPKKEIKK